MPVYSLDFENFAACDLVNTQYQGQGVTISSGTDHPTMMSDPDDSATGGSICFTFDEPTVVKTLTVLENEEGGYVKFWDVDGNYLGKIYLPVTGDGEQALAELNMENVGYMEVGLCGSGAIDNMTYDSPTLAGSAGDGYVEGTGGDDLIDASYTGDPEGDMIDASDAILPGEGPQDDIILAGAGNDTVIAGDGDDEVYAGSGDDTVDGGSGNDTIYGESGDDVINGGDGNDVLHGDSGGSCDDDHFDPSEHDISNVVFYYDTDGDGVYDYSVKVDGFPDAGTSTFISNDLDDFYAELNLYITSQDPTLTGLEPVIGVSIKGGTDETFYAVDENTNGSDPDVGPTLNTGPVNDAVFEYSDFYHAFGPLLGGGGGSGSETYDDVIDGGAGDDLITGDCGDDIITGGEGNDALYGNDDRDTFWGLNAGDTVDGGAGGDDYDVLDLTGSAPSGGSLKVTITGPDSNGNGSDGYVTYYDGDGNVTGTLQFEEIEEIVPCFTPGTLIATPKGERRVEDLQEGDRVITRDNGIQQIRWIGHKSLNWRQLEANKHLKPVLIQAGSLGNGLPERDMLVSPNHRVLVASDRTALYFEEREVLVSAKHLVDNRGIHRVDTMGTTYIHFMFDHHEVVLSDGAWTESFQPGDYTLKGIGNAQRTEIFELFPELETARGVEDYTAARRTLKAHEAKMLIK